MLEPIDFMMHKHFNMDLARLFQEHLANSESQAASAIMEALQPTYEFPYAPVLPKVPIGLCRLSEEVEGFGHRVQQMIASPLKEKDPNAWQIIQNSFNSVLWRYVELLEDTVRELFQRLHFLGIDEWTQEMATAVLEIKQTLYVKIEDAIWAIRRLDNNLSEYRDLCRSKTTSKWWKGWIKRSTDILDRGLEINLRNSQEYLKNRYELFTLRFEQLMKDVDQAKLHESKLEHFIVFSRMDEWKQKTVKKISTLLYLWEHTHKSSASFAEADVIRSVRKVMTINGVTHLFNDYLNYIEDEIYERSRKLKQEACEPSVLIQFLREQIQPELKMICQLIYRYRHFLQKTTANAYQRSHLGFTQSTTGEEPSYLKRLHDYLLKGDEIQGVLDRFVIAIEKEKEVNELDKLRQYQLLQSVLHEMGQPLIGIGLMRVRAREFIDGLGDLNELGAKDPVIVMTMTQILSKAMRADWKYHVLNESNTFHQIYDIHRHLMEELDQRQHIHRVQHMKKVIRHIELWLKEGKTWKHEIDIEQEANDLVEILQDFLGYAQRMLKGVDSMQVQGASKVISAQLLEYRYLFSHFFYHLRQHEVEGMLLRQQFLFVDQYLESVDNLLTPIKGINLEEFRHFI